MSNDIYSRDRQPYNFPAGLKIKGIDLSGFDGAKAVSLRLIDSDQSPTNLYDWVRSTHSTVESILANGIGGNSGPITTDDITDATPFGISLLKASSQTVAQNLLGLGTYVTVISSQISDATVVGKTLLTAPSIAYVKTSLGLGTAASVDSTTFATALQGTKADSALQPGALPVGTTIPVAQISNGGTVGKSVLLASTQAIAQTALGLGTAAVAATTAFATAAQGTKADTALQPGSLPVGTSITASQISDSSSIGRSLITVTSQEALQTIIGVSPTTSFTASQISDAGTAGVNILKAGTTAQAQAAIGLPNASTALQPGALPVGTTIDTTQISDASVVGKQVLTATTASSARTSLGLGTAATSAITDYATSAQGALAGSALQPGALPTGTTIKINQISDASTVGTSVLGATTQALAQSYLGLGSAATQASTAFATATHTHTAANISDASAAGRALLKGADAAAQRTSLGLGTAATTAATDYATAAQGTLATNALQPSTQLTQANVTAATVDGVNLLKATSVAAQRTLLGLGTAATTAASAYATASHTHTAANISDASAAGIDLLKGANAAAQRTSLGLGTAATTASTDYAAATHTHTAANISDASAAGRALLKGADAAAQRTSLGLGTAATTASTDYAAATHTHTAANISDASAAGRALLKGADAAAQRTSLGLGTAATTASTDYAAATHTHTAANISDASAAGRDLLKGADAAAQRTLLGLGTAATTASTAYAAASHTHTAANISDASAAGRDLLKGADAAAQRTSLGLGTAATQASTAFAAATHTQAITTITGMSTVGSALTVATSQSNGRTALGFGVNDNTTYYGTWSGRPTPTQAGEKYIITDVATRGGVNIPLSFISTAVINSTSYTVALENGYCCLHEGTIDSTVTGFTTTATQVSMGFPLKVPTFLNSGDIQSRKSSNAKLTFIYEISGGSGISIELQVRYGTTGTVADNLIESYLTTTQLVNILELNVASNFLNNIAFSWDSGRFTPSSIKKHNWYIDQGVDTYFTIWAKGGDAGAVVKARYYKVELTF